MHVAAGHSKDRPKRQASPYFNPITNLSVWTRAASATDGRKRTYLTLHSLVTPAPVTRRRASNEILNSVNPSLRAWLAPILSPRIEYDTHDDDEHGRAPIDDDDDEDLEHQDSTWLAGHGDHRRQEVDPYQIALDRNNLQQHIQYLLLADYDDDEHFNARERAAVDVLHDSARVGHYVSDLLTNHETQIQRKCT